MKRREFLTSAAVAGFAGNTLLGAREQLPRRTYKNGVELSVIGFGGIVVVGLEQAKANGIVADAIARGLNYFDVAPTYGDGEAEQKLGIALQPYRKSVFLSCKAEKRDAEGARAQLQSSLKRLNTDQFDLYQFHAVKTPEEAKQIMGPGGAGGGIHSSQKRWRRPLHRFFRPRCRSCQDADGGHAA